MGEARSLLDLDGIDIHYSDKNQTPLNVACYTGNINIVRLLLQQPTIDRDKMNDWNLTPCENVEAQGHHEIVTLFE